MIVYMRQLGGGGGESKRMCVCVCALTDTFMGQCFANKGLYCWFRKHLTVDTDISEFCSITLV